MYTFSIGFSTLFFFFPQRSSKILRKDLIGSMSEESFTVTGNVQYYQRFCLDNLGRPLVDGNPQLTAGWDVPSYPVIFHEALPIDETEKPNQNRAKRSKATCWNCGKEDHSLRDCPYPRDPVKISMARKEFMDKGPVNLSLQQRYHHDGEEGGRDHRFNHFKPGQISDNLREALGLDQDSIPPYIYQMRGLGYPPGYLKHAEVLKSGLTVYDMKDGDEPGQIESDETNARPTYDPSKLIEYPGFNVALPEGVRDPHGVPPMHPAHSKDAYQMFMTPPRAESSDNGRKRRGKDFGEDPSKKRPRSDREDIDMDLETPDARNGDSLEGTSAFKPPLPPTPIPETPPPLPTSTPPATPGNTPRLTSADTPSEFPSVDSPSQSSSTPRSMSPSIDDLQLMQSRLREALMQAAAEDGSSVPSDTDASDRFVVDGEEFIVESVSDDDVEETPEGASQVNDDVPNVLKITEESEPRTLEDDEQGHLPVPTEKEINIKTSDDAADEAVNASAEQQTSDAAGSSEDLEPGETADGGLEPGEIADSSLDATPNRSGVPHISKFAVGISPHENENMSEGTGMLRRIMSIFKRKKDKPSS
ncbi:zinc finger CCHC domain-containing protein 8-like [Patiria miniata]|uniref:CCHC-type domain-containing protein n=1 Tax=Patiria miniata TaxID=46514 RepID=A0A914AEP0_PATMI|nr:zinc finger CCHC domain-containing protein 8-like [Patiria miniata]